ncbi:Autophagocytosis protein [Entamoeba marina]
MFNSIKRKAYETYTKSVDKVKPTLTESQFIEKGVLTPEEFVTAGDFLVAKYRTWSWVGASECKKTVDYLPNDKQFLITRNIRCGARAQGGIEAKVETIIVDGEEFDVPLEEKEEEVFVDEDSDDIVDADDILDVEEMSDEGDDTVVKVESSKTRTYDITIIYSHFDRTPKVWLLGYDEDHKPLTETQMFEDLSATHAGQTATTDAHPFLGIKEIYIHPCRHAQVMKKRVDELIADGKTPRVDMYLMIFLKFLSTVIPTMEYDYGRDI